MTPIPVRIQQSRKKGARLVSPNGLPVVCVTRPSKWGNPWRVGEFSSTLQRVMSAGDAVERFKKEHGKGGCRHWLNREIKGALRGKNLACRCAVDSPCHADILLQIANGGTL